MIHPAQSPVDAADGKETVRFDCWLLSCPADWLGERRSGNRIISLSQTTPDSSGKVSYFNPIIVDCANLPCLSRSFGCCTSNN